MLPVQLEQMRVRGAAAGLNLLGAVDRVRFDASEPKERRVAAVAPRCGTIVVLGTGGRWFASRRGDACGDGGSVASATSRAAEALAETLRPHGIVVRVLRFDDGGRVSAARLGEAAGFGTVSPVSGLLLHPQFGPWLRVRAALLIDGRPFGDVPDASIAESFRPCCTCARPCLAACPAGVSDGLGHHDLAACGTHRHRGGCASECASRAACPLGAEHRDSPQDGVHAHTFELPTLQRWFGLGAWRAVPKPWRGGPCG